MVNYLGRSIVAHRYETRNELSPESATTNKTMG